jgi:streptomycin 6-kinase
LQAHVAVALEELGIAPKVHDLMATDTGTWIVMDRVVPGTPWDDLPTTAALIDALGATLGSLCERPAPAADMPSIHDCGAAG